VTQLRRVLIVGAGLLGTSLGLALRSLDDPPDVTLTDPDQRRVRLAVDLGAGHAAPPTHEPDLVIVAVPPNLTSKVVLDSLSLYPNVIVSDMASVKSQVLVEVEQGLDDPSANRRFVGGHPMAGRERSGPEAARGDLFGGQPWVLTPTAETGTDAVALVSAMVRAVGAAPVLVSAGAHDAAVAAVSHTPQLVASAMAAQLADADASALALAGPGLRDVTRIAASDPDLWTAILAANAQPVAAQLDGVIASLSAVRDALLSRPAEPVRAGLPVPAMSPETEEGTGRRGGDSVDRFSDKSLNRLNDESLAVVQKLLVRGQAGRARLPGKHGRAAVTYAVVPVVIPDEPGALARLFAAAGEAGVNIEDVSIEHAPGQPVGLVELAVQSEQATALTAGLQSRGWRVH
jgi:prephenate dehydrogenase